MPDGPHRSLPMSRAWKSLLRWAESPANPPEDGPERLKRALAADWDDGCVGQLMPDLHKIEAASGSIGPGAAVRLVEDLRRRAAGSPLAFLLLDYFARSLSGNCSHGRTLTTSVAVALKDRCVRALRQMEEHVLRECGDTRIAEISGRLGGLSDECDLSQIAKDLCDGRNGNHRRPLPKKTGLHDGPPIP